MTNNFSHLRFGYRTGDAAGQNMVGKATFAACNWILQEYPGYVENFYLDVTPPPTRRPPRSTPC